MTKNVWRCRCGKRAEVLTDENFGDCGCSDPVYGPESFYMSEECADMLDEMDKDYDEQHKHLSEARAEIERLKLVSQNQETVIAAQRRSAKAKNELIEQMREALELMLEGAMHDFHYVCQHRDNCLCWGCQKARIKAALAAERGE